MKISWTSLKISIAGAKLSHLVQKDRIWDHGSMAEQARIIFRLVQKAITCGAIESLKKYCTISCLEKLSSELKMPGRYKSALLINPVIKEIAITNVRPGKHDRPDKFAALIKGFSEDDTANEFIVHCSFVRQGDWWLLDEMN